MLIGPIELTNPVALAPMAGVTDLPFRRLCRELGAGYVVGEMLASDPGLRNSEKSKLRGVHLDEPIPRAIQIVGWDPAVMAEAARYNADQGASIIDINMGCPAKKVCKRAAGSALLGDEVLVGKILDAVVAAVDVPVTLKIRTGLSPDLRNGVAIAVIAESAGVSALAVHGRTRECKYQGVVEYETITEICKTVKIPVLANGDINNFATAQNVLNKTGASGVMIGRGAHGAPWFPGQVASFLRTGVKPPTLSVERQSEIVLRHLSDLYHFYGAERGVRIARKHIKWYARNHDNYMSFGREFNSIETPGQQLQSASEHYKKLSDSFQKAKSWQTAKKPPLNQGRPLPSVTSLQTA